MGTGQRSLPQEQVGVLGAGRGQAVALGMCRRCGQQTLEGLLAMGFSVADACIDDAAGEAALQRVESTVPAVQEAQRGGEIQVVALMVSGSLVGGGGGFLAAEGGPLILLQRGADLLVIKAAEALDLDHGHDLVADPGRKSAAGDAEHVRQLCLREQFFHRRGSSSRSGAWGVLWQGDDV